MKKIYWIIIGLFVVLVVTVTIISIRQKTASVTIGNKKYNVELAQTNSEREKGLSNRNSVDVNSGMLFVFPESNIWPFWMKDTLIPLDIIFIDNNRIVETITLQPETPQNTPTHTPKNKANYVLELNASEIEKNNFQVGDAVEIKY